MSDPNRNLDSERGFGLLFAMLVTLFFLPPFLVTVLEARSWLAAQLKGARPAREGRVGASSHSPE